MSSINLKQGFKIYNTQDFKTQNSLYKYICKFFFNYYLYKKYICNFIKRY